LDLNDLVLISVDDHIVEPPNVFDGRLPKKFEDRTPFVKRKPDGENVWIIEGDEFQFRGTCPTAGLPANEVNAEIDDYDLMRPGCWNPVERLKDMSANGVIAALGFPSIVRFCGQVLSSIRDKEFALAAVRAYNDWHIDEWCGTDRSRLIPLGLVPLWDAELAAAEVRRLARKGVHAIAFSENPAKLGYPSYYSRSWDPLWAACEDNSVVVCLHLGSSSTLLVSSDDAPFVETLSLSFVGPAEAAASLVWSHIFERFPGLKFTLSEGGAGWIPALLEKLDYVHQHHRGWSGQTFPDGKNPSDMFLDHVAACILVDNFAVSNLDYLNRHLLTWESDYPHPDGTWPTSPEHAYQALSGCADADIDGITHQNAMRLLQFDPFKSKGREQCTAGALRAQVSGHDISTRSLGERIRHRLPQKASDHLVV
jgi:predicted TIM-barrel fold metal-dependent hydrolase